MRIVSVFLMGLLGILESAHADELIYTSPDLGGHLVAPECNPGGETNCACSDIDAGISSFGNHGEVTSNVREIGTYVNAIGHKKFTENFPNGNPLALGRYTYKGKVKLPVVPVPDVNQKKNPQAVHMMIQLWDGRNALFESNKTTLEGTIYWDLNPRTPDGKEGKIKVYTKPIGLTNTNISIPPDTNWHSFEIAVDFVNQKYISITFDDKTQDLSNLELAQVPHPDWGEDVSLAITTESLAAWPQKNCTAIFSWTTQFKDAAFSLIRDIDCRGIDWEIGKGGPSIRDNCTVILASNPKEGEEVRSKDNYQYADLELKAKSKEGWPIDTSIGLERWIGVTHYGIVFTNGHLGIINQSKSGENEFYIPVENWESMKNQMHSYKFVWRPEKIELFIDGKSSAKYEGELIPNLPLPIRLNASNDFADELTSVGDKSWGEVKREQK